MPPLTSRKASTCCIKAKPIISILAGFCLKLQNHNLDLNLVAQHFIEDLPDSLHLPFHKDGTNTSQQNQQAVLPVCALRSGLCNLFLPADRD